jgi:PPP family 3-phenylpropionic acid transporter
VWSSLADSRLGTVRTLRLASLASAGAALLLSTTGSSFVGTVLGAAALGAATGPVVGLADTLTLTQLGPKRAREYGVVRLWTSGGWAVAAMGLGVFYQGMGLRWVLPVYAATMLLYAGATTLFHPTPGGHVLEAARLGSVERVFRASPRFVVLLAGVLLMAAATNGTWAFLPVRIASAGGGAYLVGLAAGLAAVVEIPIMRWSPRLSRSVSLRTIYVGGVLTYIVLLLSWSLASSPLAISLVTTMRGVGFALTYVSMVLIVGRLVPASLQNTGQVLMQTVAMGLAPVLGNVVSGAVYSTLGPQVFFLGAAAATAFSAVIIWMTLSVPALAHPSAGDE